VKTLRLPLVLLLLLASGATFPAAAGAQQMDEAPASASPVETDHELVVDGGRIAYRARVGFLPVPDSEDPAGDMFFVAYERMDTGDPATRPLTFFLNGGPGAASVYLHLGAAGPRRVVFGDDGRLPPPPARLAPNRHSWLRWTDLVFVDPVGTGFSRPRPVKKETEDGGGKTDEDGSFFEVERDLDSIGAFLRLWLDRFDRRLSPKFLVGESYGGFRAARLAHRLADRFDIRLNGVVLVSPVLEFDLLRGGDDHNLLPWITRYPSFAVTAGFHGRGRFAGIGGDPTPRVGEIEAWATEEVLPGLARLPRLPPDRRDAFYAVLAESLGLPVDLVARRRGRIDSQTFAKHLLADRRLLLGLYDGRLTGPDPRPDAPQYSGTDPSFDTLTGPFATAFAAYLADELGYRSDRRYLVLARDLVRRWNWRQALRGGMGYPGASDELVQALVLLPDLRVLIVHGYHDLVTTWYATRWVIDHEPMPDSVRERIEWLLLPGGHMPYLRREGLERLDVRAESFYRLALGRTRPARP